MLLDLRYQFIASELFVCLIQKLWNQILTGRTKLEIIKTKGNVVKGAGRKFKAVHYRVTVT